MLSDSNSEFEEVVNYGLLSTLAPAHDLMPNLQRFKRSTRDSASRLPVEEAIAENLRYPGRSFAVGFRMRRESILGSQICCMEEVRMIGQPTSKSKAELTSVINTGAKTLALTTLLGLYINRVVVALYALGEGPSSTIERGRI